MPATLTWIGRLITSVVVPLAMCVLAPPLRADALAAMRYVAPGGSDAGDCSDSGHPCATVQRAINVATAGDAVLLQSGTYREAIATTFGVPVTLSITGGWNAGYTVQAGTSTIDATNRQSPSGSGQALRLANPADDVSLDRLVLTGGSGGGASLNGSRMSATRSVFTANRGSFGGGITSRSGTVWLTDSEVTVNTASDDGAGIGNIGGTLTLVRTTVANNTVDIGRFDGGGILSTGPATIAASTIRGNRAREGGGLRGGPFTIMDSVISDNTSSTDGGGVYGPGTFTRTAVTGNHAAGAGGGMYQFGGTSVLVDMTISGNQAGTTGGGMYDHGGTITVSSTSVTRNSAQTGGGLYDSGYTVYNSLIAENTAADGPDCRGSVGALGYNLVGTTTGCAGFDPNGDTLNVDAKLGPVINGVQTITVNSPAVNAGNPATPGSGGTACPATDQRNVPRLNRCDIGAYELDDTTPPLVTPIPDRPALDGWYRDNVTLTWSASDPAPSSGAPTVPAPTTAATEGRDVSYASEPSCDPAGNCTVGSVKLSIDRTPPTVTAAATPAPNAAGWYNTDVTATFTCIDALSGVRSCPAPVTLAGSGTGQSATGTATDLAGNSAGAAMSGINIDKVPPTINSSPTTSPNAAGWYRSDVGIAWTCADTLSGLTAGCPDPTMVTGEGDQIVVTASVGDKAGNTTTASSPPLRIDRTAPLTTVSAPSSWVNGTVTLTLSAHDALSGIGGTFFQLDGAPPTGGTAVSISQEGEHRLAFWSTDLAGNTEQIHTVTVLIDRTPPSITHALTPPPNSQGWNAEDTTVTFSCADALSGIASCTPPRTVTGEGKDQLVTGTAVDKAGNRTVDPALVSIDRTPPLITLTRTPPANANGWANTPVTIGFSCSDSLSGIAACAQPIVLASDGTGLSATGDAVDAAGNRATATVSGIKIDATPPSAGPLSFSNSPQNTLQAGTFSASAGDALSGVVAGEYYVGADPGIGAASPAGLVAGVLSASVAAGRPAGLYPVGIRARDAAGNWSATSTGMLTVYDPSAGFVTGAGWLIPGGSTSDPGDALPGIDGKNKADLHFEVKYHSASSTIPDGALSFTYRSGQFDLSTTTVAWMVITGPRATLQGNATISGQIGSFPIRLIATDGGGAADHVLLRVYRPGGNPDTDQPLYQASGDLTGQVIVHG